MDPNLRLILLEAAWSAGLVPPFDREQYYRDVLNETLDWEADYNYQRDDRVYDALLEIPLPDEILAQLKKVAWDGGKKVFSDIWTYWSGETDDFDVQDLSGIEKASGLEIVIFVGGGALADLQPLLALPRLKTLELSYRPNDANQAVLATLAGRGVKVDARPLR